MPLIYATPINGGPNHPFDQPSLRIELGSRLRPLHQSHRVLYHGTVHRLRGQRHQWRPNPRCTQRFVVQSLGNVLLIGGLNGCIYQCHLLSRQMPPPFPWPFSSHWGGCPQYPRWFNPSFQFVCHCHGSLLQLAQLVASGSLFECTDFVGRKVLLGIPGICLTGSGNRGVEFPRQEEVLWLSTACPFETLLRSSQKS